jgi:hypothetical protein
MDEIADDQLAGRDGPDQAGPLDPGQRGLQPPQRLQGVRRPALLDQADGRVEGDNHRDRDRVQPLTEHQPGHRRRGQQQQRHRLGELPEEAGQQAFPPRSRQLVWPIGGESAGCLRVGEATVGQADAELRRGGPRRPLMLAVQEGSIGATVISMSSIRHWLRSGTGRRSSRLQDQGPCRPGCSITSARPGPAGGDRR